MKMTDVRHVIVLGVDGLRRDHDRRDDHAQSSRR